MRGFGCPHCREATAVLLAIGVVTLIILVAIEASTFKATEKDLRAKNTVCQIDSADIGLVDCEVLNPSDGSTVLYTCYQVVWIVRASGSQTVHPHIYLTHEGFLQRHEWHELDLVDTRFVRLS